MKLNSTARVFALFILSLSYFQAFSQVAIPTGSFGNACLTTGTVTWDNSVMAGSDRVLVFAKAGSAITVGTPTANYTTYTANPAFGSGTAYQNDAAAFCVYKGTAGTENLTNLTAGTTYHFLIFNTNAATTYSAGLAFSGPTLTAPGDVSGLAAATGNGQSSVSWTNPTTCFDQIMIVASTSTVSGTPTGDGTAYTGNLTFGSGTAFGGGFVVYEGSSSPQVAINLTNGLTYFFKVWSRKTSTWSAGVETSVTLPPSPVTAGSFTATCTDAGTVGWTNPAAVYNVVVFAKATSAVTVGSPTNNVSTYTANTAFGTGTAYQNDAAAFCVYNGSGATVNITGLTAGVTYHFLVFNANGTNYSTSAAFNNPTPAAPANVSGVGDTAGDSQFDADWTNPGSCFDEIMVVAKATSAVTAVPTGNGSAYTANAAFGSGTAIVAGEFVVFKGTGNSVTITALTNCVTYHYRVYTRKGTAWSAGVADTETPSAAPTATLFPLDGATLAATNTSLTLTFNQNVTISGTGGSAASQSIVITENGAAFQTIPRASGSISIVGNVVTVDINDLNLSDGSLMTYDVVVGDKVFAGCTADFPGVTTTNWQFSSSTGVTVTAPTAGVCENVFTPIGDIVLTETAVNNFQGTPSSGLTLVLRFDVPGFSFKSGIVGVSVVPGGGGDVSTAVATTVSFSSGTMTINFPAGNAINNMDVLTIQGLQVTSDGTSGFGHIVRDASSTLGMQGITVGDFLATINTGVEPPEPTLTGFSTGTGTYCQGTNISAITVTVTGTGIKWYSDIGLNTIVYSGNPATIQGNLGINPSVPGTTTLYAASTSGCTGPGLAVPITIFPSPGADADDVLTGTDQCSGNPITLGGSPTINTPSTPPYTYAWTELTGNYTGPAIASVSNPSVTIDNLSGITQNYQFRVTVTDDNLCTAQDVANFDVFPQAFPSLTQPGSTTFTTETPPQPLAANFTTISFTGIGVIQTSATTFRFDPTQAYDNTQPLPQNFQIFFNGTDPSGCPIVNYHIETMTLSNNTFLSLQNEYCSAEYPTSTTVGGAISLGLSGTTLTNIGNYVTSWNTTYKDTYYSTNWNGGITYFTGELVWYGGQVYRCLFTHSGLIPTLNPGAWLADGFRINFTSRTIRNYYEGYYGGNASGPTVRATGATSYELLTNINYNNCPTCDAALPYAYVEFDNQWDMRYYMGEYYPFYYYYPGDIVYGTASFGGLNTIWRCTQYNSPGFAPPPNGSYWQNITVSGFDVGWAFHNPAANKSGFNRYGQFVTINKNPSIFFSGLVDGQDICEVDVADASNVYDLASNLSPGTASNTFEVSFDRGATWVKDLASSDAIENIGINSGEATFNSGLAWTEISSEVSGGGYAWSSGTTYDVGDNVTASGVFYTSLTSSNLNNPPASNPTDWRANTLSVDIRHYYDPGTTGSTPGSGDVHDVCAGISQITVYIHKSPTIAFTAVPPAIFCNNDPAVNVTTVQTTGVILSGNGITDATPDGLGLFTPNTAFAQDVAAFGNSTSPHIITITATITDAFGCQNTNTMTAFTVNPAPGASYTVTSSIVEAIGTTTLGTEINFCYNDPPASIDGDQNFSWFDVTFEGSLVYSTGSLGSPDKNFSFDPSQFFDDAVMNNGANPQNTLLFQLSYTTYIDDGQGCTTNISVVTLAVAPSLQVEITGIADNQVFCANEADVTLQFTPYQSSGTTFRINTTVIPISSNTYVYNLGNANLGDIVFDYNIASGSGNNCQNPTSKTIHVMPAPQADFTADPRCDGDSIIYVGTDTAPGTFPPGPQPAWTISPTFTWDLGDNPPVTLTGSTVGHKYSTIGNYSVVLDIAYDPSPAPYSKVCRANNPGTSTVQVVGPIPTVDFTFSNVCNGDATNFVSSQTNGVTQYNWDFGNTITTNFGPALSAPSASNTGGTFQNPIHTFTPGTYSVMVTGMTSLASGGCTNSFTRVVSSLPKMTIDPTNFYDMGATNGGWVMEDKAGFSLWNFGPAAPPVVNPHPAIPPQDAWNNIPYNSGDDSYVNSPCFDMSAYDKPAISLQFFMDGRQQQDGAVLQYSTTVISGIQQWVTVGAIASGQTWYNTQGVSGKPGDPFNATFLGWSRVADYDWQEAKHALDVIPKAERGKVRFRIAFGSDGGSTLGAKGFAFNHVTIEERNRISLIENFTNANAPGASLNNTAFQSFLSTNLEIVKLEYHVGLPSPDPINMQNQDDPNARAAFYGLTNSPTLIPRGYLDGESQGNFTTGWLTNAFNLRSLKASPMTINVTSTPTSVQATATPTLTITNGHLRFFVAAIEKTVGSEQFVVRKLYPSAAGQTITLPFGPTNPATISIDPWIFDVQQINDNTEIGVVAFVQDLDTREVLQAFYLDTPDNPAVVTGLEPLTDTQVRAFPVPADKEFTVDLPAAAAKDIPLRLVNQLGQSVVTKAILAGESKKTVSTAQLAEGVYILNLGDNGSVARKKIVVVH